MAKKKGAPDTLRHLFDTVEKTIRPDEETAGSAFRAPGLDEESLNVATIALGKSGFFGEIEEAFEACAAEEGTNANAVLLCLLSSLCDTADGKGGNSLSVLGSLLRRRLAEGAALAVRE